MSNIIEKEGSFEVKISEEDNKSQMANDIENLHSYTSESLNQVKLN